MPFTGIKETVFRQGLDVSCAALLRHIRVWPGEEKHALAWKERNAPHDIFPLECAVYERFDRRNKKPARITVYSSVSVRVSVIPPEAEVEVSAFSVTNFYF